MNKTFFTLIQKVMKNLAEHEIEIALLVFKLAFTHNVNVICTSRSLQLTYR